jgi:hypothetical protein
LHPTAAAWFGVIKSWRSTELITAAQGTRMAIFDKRELLAGWRALTSIPPLHLEVW